MSIDLPLVWAGVLGFGIIMYVILDGFSLGIGILFPWIIEKAHRDIMMNSIAPIWDGNETWLVFGSVTLYTAFPHAYSMLLPRLYMPIMIMVCALIFRGVAFEFRFKANTSKWLWDAAFAGGSLIATCCQGLILGAFVHGNLVSDTSGVQHYVWFSGFSVMTGIALIAGYALLGATWLIIKTEDSLQKEMFNVAKILLILVVFFIGVVSLWTPLIDVRTQVRWFSLPNFFYLLPLPLSTLAVVVGASYSLQKRYEILPFVCTVLLFLFSYLGLCVTSWPYIVPHTLSIWQAAASTKSLSFALIGTALLLPVLIGYSIYAYTVFRGKVKADHGYHH